MAQFARPEADIYNSDGWTEDDSTTVDIFAEIDESVASDTDYIESPLGPIDDVYVTRLSDVEDPISSSNHIVRYRYQKDASGGATVSLIVQLRQGYTNEGSPGTLIAAETVADVPNGWTDGDFTLAGGEADSITDYTDLYLRFVADTA